MREERKEGRKEGRKKGRVVKEGEERVVRKENEGRKVEGRKDVERRKAVESRKGFEGRQEGSWDARLTILRMDRTLHPFLQKPI